MSDKFSPVFDNLKRNAKRNAKIKSRVEDVIPEAVYFNRQEILKDFQREAGCLPSEAEFVVERVAGGVRTYLRKRVD